MSGLPDDWNGKPGINDVYDLADDDPTRCQATRGDLACNRPTGHDAVGFGHFDQATETVWWPETDSIDASDPYLPPWFVAGPQTWEATRRDADHDAAS